MSSGSIIRRDLKNGKTSWLLKYDTGRDPKSGKRKQAYKTVRGTKKEAEAELRRLLKTVDDGQHVDPTRMTLKDWLESWITDHAAHTVSVKTCEGYDDRMKMHVIPHIGHIPIQKLTAPDVQALYTKLQTPKKEGGSGLGKRSALHVHRNLHQALATAVRQNVIPSTVTSKVTPPKPPRASIETLDKEQLGILLNALRSPAVSKGRAFHPFYPVVAIAAATGMRRGEVLALRWSDIDLPAGKLRVARSVEITKKALTFKEPKTAMGKRTISLSANLVQMLRTYQAAQHEERLKCGLGRYPEDGLLFPRSVIEPERARDPRKVTHAFADWVKKLELPDISFHALRHTHATLLLKEGVPIKVVSERLGHAKASITLDIYAHATKDMQEQAAEIAGSIMADCL